MLPFREAWKIRKKWASENRLGQYKWSVFLERKGIRSLKRLVNDATEMSKISTASSDAKGRVPEWEMLYINISHFQLATNYKTGHLHIKLKNYNGNMAVCTHENAKWTNTLTNADTFGSKSTIKVFCFSVWLKSACNTNKVFDRMVSWIMFLFKVAKTDTQPHNSNAFLSSQNNQRYSAGSSRRTDLRVWKSCFCWINKQRIQMWRSPHQKQQPKKHIF